MPIKVLLNSPELGSTQLLGDVKSLEKTSLALQGNYGLMPVYFN